MISRLTAPSAPHRAAWLAQRAALWPDSDEVAHRADIDRIIATPERFCAFLAFADAKPAGFAEASIRHDYVDGTETSPVAFLEGIYVLATHRRRGIARALIAEVAAWGRAQGCRELTSNALLDNLDSHALHRAVGFEETERVVFFRRRLG